MNKASNTIKKITLTAMMIVLAMFGTRLPALLAIPSADFIRISFGPSLIIFSSLVLGPIYGGVVGAISDLLGVVVFPSTLGIMASINPLITLMYCILGIIPYLIMKFFARFKKIYSSIFPMIIFMLILILFVGLFLLKNDDFTLFNNAVHTLPIWLKITIFVSVLVLSTAVCIVLILKKKKLVAENEDASMFYQIAFLCLICELLIILLLGSFIKSIYYGINFVFILFVQSVIFFIDIPLNTFIVFNLYKLYMKHHKF